MWTEEKLDSILSEPSEQLIKDFSNVKGDIIILGAGGKMGPTLALLAKRALNGSNNKVIAVSRFGDDLAVKLMKDNNIEIISADLMEHGALDKLPNAENVIYMAGKKFGTNGNEHETWAMNAWLPAMVAERYKNSRIVVFSSGNVYPQLPLYSGGASEEIKPEPIGEYGMSCLARERIFEHGSIKYGTPVCIYRLNYAVDLRYGVLFDIASKLMNDEAIPVDMGVFNCIWQQSANEIALRCLLHCESPANKINVTGPETISVRKTALMLAENLGKRIEDVKFVGVEGDKALLSDASRSFSLFGYPSVNVETLIKWQAQWIKDGGRSLGKPTHFEEKKGAY